jgi:energy-coupling factor transporter ATP-binding protein EcfA2
MRLHRFEYREQLGEDREWKLLPFTLGPTTLIVGRNASGKTRLLNVIHAMARLLGGQHIGNGIWSAEWRDTDKSVSYDLVLKDGHVLLERLVENMAVLLERGSDGSGNIRAVEAGAEHLKFKIPPTALAAATKRDELQHPFLEQLHQWARDVRYYPFGTSMGRDSLAFFHEKGAEPDPTNAAQVVALFYRGRKEFGHRFVTSVLGDMGRVGYDLESIEIAPLQDMILEAASLPVTPSGLTVKERDVTARVRQLEMSQGMFRTLSIIIHLNYAEAAGRPSCVLIDDVGEGLDFDRSTKLIHLLVDRTQQQQVQLIMSTNDRFVMNAVRLECWAVLNRAGNTCRVFNYENSKERFDEFKLTGLNNFDLFRTNYLETAGVGS